MTLLALMIGLPLIAYATRIVMIASFGKTALPAVVTRFLEFVPVAVLMSIAAPGILVREGAVGAPWLNARLLAAIPAAFVAYRTRNLLFTIATGMLSVWGLQALGWKYE
jgi:branched-subunit amino acid transport protein